MKKVLFLIVVAVLIVGGGAFYFFHNKSQTTTTSSLKIMEIEPVVINLADGHYIRIAVALGYSGDENELREKLPVINDILITTVGAMTSKELVSPEGKELLKENLLLKINSALSEVKVKNIFYREFIVQ
ncbi:MAG: hypothetical protein DSY35_03700 [Desulfurobacterium sp.]|nr:MAG: hypothetical protein DSY35_03700 [Desulfurobacterium sp.]